MDLSSKRSTSTLQLVQNRNVSLQVDRLSSLPDELVIRILSLLPTKDAAACILSRRMRHVFRWITTLDFDDSPISHCLRRSHLINCFPTFVTFVHTVLKSYQSQTLTRFRLQVGPDFITRYFQSCMAGAGGCENECLPNLKSTHINRWISFALNRFGLRELDLLIQMRQPGDNDQLPSSIFLCETLDVLKLDVNLGFDQVFSMPSFHLPNLKILHLRASFISDDGFVPRLVSSLPLLEELTVEAWWNHVHSTSISSSTLKRLCLRVHKLDVNENTDFVLIHTPNLEYLEYYDNLASHYSIQNMPRLVKADIAIGNAILDGEIDISCQQILSFIKPLSKVQHLSLLGSCTEDLNFLEEEDQLPKFPALKFLDLGSNGDGCWDKVLLAFLNCSPILETLVFSQGLMGVIGCSEDREADVYEGDPLDLERVFCRKTQPIIPLCCRSHLKRIVIKYYSGKQREVDLIQFLLRHTLVLEELLIYRSRYPIADQLTLEDTLKNLPRASVACSIQVQ